MMEKRKIKLYIYSVAKKGQSRNEGCPEAKVELPESLRRMEQDGTGISEAPRASDVVHIRPNLQSDPTELLFDPLI